MRADTEAALAVAAGVFVLFGGLKAALWPWLERRRVWVARESALPVNAGLRGTDDTL